MDLSTWIVLVIATAVFFLIVQIRNQWTYWKKRGVPHSSDIPLISGIGTFLFRQKSFPEFATELYYRFPDAKYYGFLNFGSPTILLRDPDLIREVCIKNFEKFTDHRSFVDEKLDPIFGRNVFSLKGQMWKEMRGTLSPSFTASKMKFMFQLLSKCANDFVSYYAKNPEDAKCIDMKDAFTRYTNDVIATAAFGISVNSLEDKTNEFYLRGKDASNFNGFVRALKFFLLMVAPTLAGITRIKFLNQSTASFFTRLVSDTVKIRDEKGIVRPDMIHLLMQARDKEGVEMSITDIVAQAFIFFVAGFDTASTLMCYMAHEIAANSDIQAKLQKEVDENFPDDGELTYETMLKMKYMDMVMNESLRKYPPAPMTDRVCTESYQLPEAQPGTTAYKVEVGMNMSIPIYALHHDPNYFPDPDKFDPERFSDENKANIDPCIYMPFGIGPRKCIANRFALMETKILFAHILHKFDIKLTTKSRHPIIFSRQAFNMLAEGGFWNQLQERKKEN